MSAKDCGMTDPKESAAARRNRFMRLAMFERSALTDMIRTARLTYQGERIETLRRTGQDTNDSAKLLELDEQARLFLIELEGE